MIRTNYGRTKAMMFILMAFLMASFSLKAEAPKRPLFIAMDYSSYDRSLIVETTISGDYENVDGFRLYVKYPWQSDPVLQLFEDVPRNDSLMKHYENFYSFILWKELKEGEYKFVLTAYNSDGESVPSDTITLNIGGINNPEDYVMIYADSLYNGYNSAYIGKVYKVQFTATAYSGKEVNFKLEQGPQGMVIDPVTGILTWTPTEWGEFDFIVRAFVKEEPEIFSDFWWRLKVAKCSQPAVIKGKVIDKENGSLVEKGFITILQPGIDSTDFYYGKYWCEIINGEFSLEIDEGTYYLMAQGDFENTWYENAKDYTEATPIQVKCGEISEITVKVKTLESFPTYTVSGRVTDKEGKPFLYGYVEFFSVDNGGKYGVVNSVSFDSEGYYNIKLSSEFKYIARAFGFNDQPIDTVFNPIGYTPVYYNQVTNPNDATVLVLSEDITGINFILGEQDSFDNSLTGYLKNEKGEVIRDGFIVAYLVGSDLDYKDELYFGKFAQTDINGKFEIKNLVPGIYVILGMPMSSDYMPGFYVEGKTATWLWEEATKVKVDFMGNSGDFDVILPEMVKIGGIKGIRGLVVADGGIVKKTTDSPMGQQPVSGAIVYAVDKNNVKVKYDVTDQDGKFEINGLLDGTYKLYVDKVGFKYSTETISIDKEDLYNETNLVLTGQKTGVTDNDNAGNSVSSYPVPASDHVSFNTPLMSGRITMKVYDSKGNVVITTTDNYDNGVNILHLDVSSLNSGSYFVNIQNGTAVHAVPFVIVR